ncbi:hypothetical protein BKA70DRAFT_1229313 [Coprinopsis sp. MPI-PUGE-AT-0042]|nr:hypothetical protein BKA70DRAFT_1229313 [Coprinopsis sp. MPI-PUGE-AT-0042]
MPQKLDVQSDEVEEYGCSSSTLFVASTLCSAIDHDYLSNIWFSRRGVERIYWYCSCLYPTNVRIKEGLMEGGIELNLVVVGRRLHGDCSKTSILAPTPSEIPGSLPSCAIKSQWLITIGDAVIEVDSPAVSDSIAQWVDVKAAGGEDPWGWSCNKLDNDQHAYRSSLPNCAIKTTSRSRMQSVDVEAAGQEHLLKRSCNTLDDVYRRSCSPRTNCVISKTILRLLHMVVARATALVTTQVEVQLHHAPKEGDERQGFDWQDSSLLLHHVYRACTRVLEP